METMETQTHTLETPDVDLVYDVAGPLPTADGQPPLLLAGHPMTAEGFQTLDGKVLEGTVERLGFGVGIDDQDIHGGQLQIRNGFRMRVIQVYWK